MEADVRQANVPAGPSYYLDVSGDNNDTHIGPDNQKNRGNIGDSSNNLNVKDFTGNPNIVQNFGPQYISHSPVEERSLAEKLEKLIQLLSTMNCAKKHDRVRTVTRNQPQAGRWLLEHESYTRWKTRKARTRLLLLMGAPGAGKTVLSSAVVDDLRKQQGNTIVTLFYCEHQYRQRHDSTDLLANLFSQILRKVRPGSLAVQNLLQEYPSVQSIYDLPLVDLIMRFSPEFDEVYVVIDALDEWNDLESLLSHLSALSVNTYVFVTSRDHFDVREALKEHPVLEVHGDMIIDDVRRFVEKEAKRIRVGEELRHFIVKTLVSSAQGTFLLPAYHMPILQRLGTEREIRKALNDLPQGIDGTFLRALDTIDCHPNSERLRWVLRIVIYAVRPLAPLELAEGVATLEMEEEWDESRVVQQAATLIDSCANLLTCVYDSWRGRIVIPFHASVKDFLSANPTRLGGNLIKYSLHPSPAVHDDLAKLCLTYLRLRYVEGIPSSYIFLFTSYAAMGWLAHISASATDTLARNFREFFAHDSATLQAWKYSFGTWKNKYRGLEDRLGSKSCHGLRVAIALDLPAMIRHFSDEELKVEDQKGLPLVSVALLNGSVSVIGRLVKCFGASYVIVNACRIPVLHVDFSETWIKSAVECFEQLLRAGASVDMTTSDCSAVLHSLMMEPELAIPFILPLLRLGANINARDADSCTPLHIAVANPQSQTKRRQSNMGNPARIAQNHTQIMTILLENGADIHCVDRGGNTPLHHASRTHASSCMTLLLSKGATVGARNNDGCTPLHLVFAACAYGLPNQSKLLVAMEILLDHGADPGCMDDCGNTPLHHLTRSLISSTAVLSRKSKSNPDFPDDITAHTDIGHVVRILLEKGANVNARNKDGHSPLLLVCMLDRDQETVPQSVPSTMRILLHYGADPNCMDKHRNSLLHYMAHPGFDLVAEMLLRKGANLNAHNKDSHLSLLLAHVLPNREQQASVQQSALSTLRILLHHKADPNCADQDGNGPLHYAAHAGCHLIVEELLEKGANVNAYNKKGYSPLLSAFMSLGEDAPKKPAFAGALDNAFPDMVNLDTQKHGSRSHSDESDDKNFQSSTAATPASDYLSDARRRLIESELRRRDELRKGYERLRETLLTSNKKLSRVSLLDGATMYICSLESENEQLEKRLQIVETEVNRLRRSISETLMINAEKQAAAAAPTSDSPPSTFFK